MKLFYSSGASPLAAHILLRESGLPFELERVDLQSKTWSGGDYGDINAKLYVPALLTNDGKILTEGSVILQYIADQVPEKRLLPPQHAFERYRALEWLNFIGMELHKNFITRERHGDVAANFLSKTHEGQALTHRLVIPRLDFVATQLEEKPYLLGRQFSAPDAYLFVMLTWAGRLSLDIARWPSLVQFYERMRARPAVAETLDVEGPAHSLTPPS
ncbi:glutathione S-transferase N-terminal domain-containing protein [Gluconobacter potus]|uniref:glutathione S-transferase N-terminal domain-containing protein n=1 Tax=Gluconobacter potus TaxID=2724927 RepID=UPI0039E9AC76